jgi:ankyrin repeat protein
MLIIFRNSSSEIQQLLENNTFGGGLIDIKDPIDTPSPNKPGIYSQDLWEQFDLDSDGDPDTVISSSHLPLAQSDKAKKAPRAQMGSIFFKLFKSNTALHRAAKKDDTKKIKTLLDSGVDINYDSSSGCTALHLAADCGHEAVVRLLLDNGADPQAKSSEGRTPLHSAARIGHTTVVRLLLEKDVDFTARDPSGSTALHIAAYNGHASVVQILLEKYPFVDIRGPSGFTALHFAAFNGQSAIVRLLVEMGANLEAQSDTGRTALQLAAEKGHEAVVRHLLQHGANIMAKDRIGRTALQGAVLNQHGVVAQLLMDNMVPEAPSDWQLQRGYGSGPIYKLREVEPVVKPAELDATESPTWSRQVSNAPVHIRRLPELLLDKVVPKEGPSNLLHTFGGGLRSLAKPMESDDIGGGLPNDGEELANILSYCDAESTTDSSSNASLELADLSSFAASHNDAQSPDWSDLPASVEDNPHLRRLLWPQKEHEDLLAVRTEVLNKSFMLNVGRQAPSLNPNFESTVLETPTNETLPVTSDPDVDKVSQQLKSLRKVLTPDSYQLFSEQLSRVSSLDREVLESFDNLHRARNIFLSAYANIKHLQLAGLCEDTISIISMDKDRIDVAALQPISKSFIEAICCDFELSIQAFGSLSEVTIRPQKSGMEKEKLKPFENLGMMLTHLERNCLAFLGAVFGQESGKLTGLRAEHLWDLTAKTLDIAVAFYSCAHVEQPHYNSFQFTDGEAITLRAEPDMVFGVVLRNLRCLNGLLQSRRVWVFYTSRMGSSSSQPIHERSLYLTTRIKDLGDIWGPAWGLSLGSQPGAIRAYDIGGGSIVPWKHDHSLHPTLKRDERLCHWQKIDDGPVIAHSESAQAIAATGFVADLTTEMYETGAQTKYSTHMIQPMTRNKIPVKESQSSSQNLNVNALASELADIRLSASHQLERVPDISLGPFLPDDQLLIGAAPPRLRFEVCRCKKECLVAELQNSACLYPLNTRRGHHYIDSTSKGISGGQYVNLNASKTKKWEKMITWKQVILEEWEKNPALRGQAIPILEYFVGVVVSLCTFNATRVRLVELFKTDSMRHVLANFQWIKPDGKQLFFEALGKQDYHSIRRLWRDREDLHEDIGNAISACLKILASTGYDEPHDELNLLWIPSFQPRQDDDLAENALPHRVVLKGSKHQWVRLLRDTEISCTMAVMVEDSLANRGHGGRSCRRRGPNRPTVLETAIRVNGQVDPSKRLQEQPITLVAGNQDP